MAITCHFYSDLPWAVRSHFCILILERANPGLFLIYFHLFIVQYRKVIASRIQTRIDDVEGKSADHYTTTTAQPASLLSVGQVLVNTLLGGRLELG